MSATFSDYLTAIHQTNIQPIARVQFLDLITEEPIPDEIITGDIIDGTLTINRANGIRRTISMTLSNVNGKYTPNPDGLWCNTKFEVWLGVKTENGDYLLPNGVFVLRAPSNTSFSNGDTIQIDGADKFYLLNGSGGNGVLETTYIVPTETDMNQIIRSVLQTNIGGTTYIPLDAKQPILSPLTGLDALTPYTLRKDIGDNYGNLLLDLNTMRSRNMYYDATGRLRFEDDFSDEIKGSVWDFSDEEVDYYGSTYDYQFEDIRNYIVVIGGTLDGEIFDAVAYDDDPKSDTSVSRIGRRVEIIRDENILDNETAQAYAKYCLKRLNAKQTAISIACRPMFHIDVDDAITLTDKRHGLLSGRFIIENISIPLGFKNQMSISAVNTTETDITV